MAHFVEGGVRVTVPATSANLGPGYDSLGLALDLRDELQAEVLEPGRLEIEIDGEGAGGVPRDESHLVIRAMRRGFEALNCPQPGIRLRCRNVIPHSRGLGSSSAAVVGGLALARGLVGGGTLICDDQSLFRVAAEIEGHPDNVAPAFFGGFVVAGHAEEFYAVPTAVDPRVSTVVFVPPHGLNTEVARTLIPAQVPHAQAAENSARTALLVQALTGRPEHLFNATRDFLHQEYRRSAMPASLELVDRLRGQGVAAVVSGAGPTVLAFTGGPRGAASREALVEQCPEGWQAWPLEVSRTGITVR